MSSDFYTHLSSITKTRPYLLANKSEILFEVTEEYGFIISFKNPVRDDEDEDLELDFEEERELRFMSSSELATLPSFSEADYIQLYTSEIYGHRENDSTDNFVSQSISKTLYALLRELYNLDKHLVLEYRLHTNEGFEDWGSMCSVGDYFNYLFLINIRCTDQQLFKIVELLTYVNLISPKVSDYIAKDYISLRKLSDSKKVNILNTNTKARRLGYLKLLGKYFKKYPQTPISQFHKRYESFVIPYQNQLNDSINSKGVVTVSKRGVTTGSSAKPYVEIANSLGFINSLNRVATVSKSYKVYVELLSLQDIENPFKLNLLDKIFFGENILKHDFLYMSMLLEIIYIRQTSSFIELKKVYRDCLIKRLRYFQQEYFYIKERGAVENIKRIEARIINWEQPDRYLEHVLMPRLNWLADLNFIELPKSTKREVNISITSKGSTFFECLCDWYDLQFDWVLNPDELIDSFFPYVFAKTYNITQDNALTYEDIRSIILGKINDCFEIFKTMAANRVTLSQVVSYVQYIMLIDIGVSVSRKYVDNMIQNEFKDLFIYKFQTQFNDGYLQKIKD